MRRLILIAGGLISLAAAYFLTVAPAAADEPPQITTRTLVNQRVELLPQEPLCWDVRTGSLTSGGRAPASGYHSHGLIVIYISGGAERLDYADGLSRAFEPGTGIFVGGSNWHAHTSVGTAPRTNIAFELTCQPQPGSLGNSGVLPSVRAGLAPYQVQLRERQWPVGAQTPVHVLSGTTTTYVLEGTIAQASLAGVTRYGPGSIYVVPPNTTGQNTSVGSSPARTLDVDLWPASAERSQTLTGVQVPSAGPSALPRTGEETGQAGWLAFIVGTLLLVAGIGLRWART